MVAVAIPSVTVVCAIASFPLVNVTVPPLIGVPSAVVTVAVSVIAVLVAIDSGTASVVVVSTILFSLFAVSGALIVSSPYP